MFSIRKINKSPLGRHFPESATWNFPAPLPAMNIPLRFLPLCAGLISLIPLSEASPSLSPLIYHPESDAIVIRNGTRWDNRPLYCNERFSYVWAGEMPGLSGQIGRINAGFERKGVRVMLHQFENRIMRYRPGRMEWELNDQRFPGLTVTLTATTLADANGITARLATKGSQPGDQALWAFFPSEADKKSGIDAKTTPQGYRISPNPSKPLSEIAGTLSQPVTTWEMLKATDRDLPNQAVPLVSPMPAGAGLLASVAVADQTPLFVAVASDDNDKPGYARLKRRQKALDPAAVADPTRAFEQGMKRVLDFSSRLVISTPDPYLNAGAPMAVAAAAGLFVDPVFVHGGSHWRQQQPGWRTMGGAIYFGWAEQVLRAVSFWGDLQVKDNGKRTHAEYSTNGCQQAGNSRFFGAGFIDYKQPPHYEFQTQFFDEAIRAWRASGDKELEKILRPMLELHLQRCKDCYDPDGNGIYESYNNTWPNDSIWFNGGGTPEQSGYVYYGHRAAADMARRAGDAAAAKKHDAIADKIRDAVNQLLWMPDRQYYASYVEPWGHKRQMPDAWIYAQHVPIEAGLSTPEQAWKAMFYTEWAMERFKLPYGGEMRQTSNFVPGQWSIRELYHGDNFGMALGYFLAGQGDEGWNLFRGTMLESMYADGTPKSGYSNERGTFNNVNRISPGGLSHPNCSVDFNDIVSPYCRALVEGLFGYRPDYPNNIVRMEPSFPAAWDHASIRTPDFSLDFKNNTYQLDLTKPAAVRFGIPVRAAKVKQVTVNGKPAKFTIEPWAGYGMLRVDVPSTNRVVLALETEGAATNLPILEKQEEQGVPGCHLEITKQDGGVPRFQLTKVNVPKAAEPKVLREAPANATWKPIDLTPVFNGDLRTIFRQRYDAPRPDRVSMRIGYDGWSAWTFKHWGVKTPEIKMEKVLDKPDPKLIQGDQLVTPQNAHFTKPAPDKNIAFTSLWTRWPASVTIPVNAKGEALWLLVAGSTTPMQGKIANAVFRFKYADGKVETLDLVPPENFWSLCLFGRTDYTEKRDGFSLPKQRPPQLSLGSNCRAMVYGWKLRPGVELKEITLETLSLDVVIGLMAASIMNP
jgi:hypothetical protein